MKENLDDLAGSLLVEIQPIPPSSLLRYSQPEAENIFLKTFPRSFPQRLKMELNDIPENSQIRN